VPTIKASHGNLLAFIASPFQYPVLDVWKIRFTS
jgi:hypothetical protein